MLICEEKEDIGWDNPTNKKLEEYKFKYSWEQSKEIFKLEKINHNRNGEEKQRKTH